MYSKTLALAAFALTATQALAEPADYYTPGPPNADDLRAIADANPALSIQETDKGEVDAMIMLSDVLFEFGKSDLSPAALATLDVVAKELGDVPGLKVIGHTDDIGPEDTNLALGLERAKAVRAWIAEQTGLDPEAIAVDSAGETKPIAANKTANGADNAEGRALNRRVEFKIVTDTPTDALSDGQASSTINAEIEPLAAEKTSTVHPKQQVI